MKKRIKFAVVLGLLSIVLAPTAAWAPVKLPPLSGSNPQPGGQPCDGCVIAKKIVG